ncbi:14 kDa zinc-binding protein [Canna indica]|uniref:14 kDa zinc-binding protein n=1 Tax=Canna indica TaxID=4628 RepID=A0AAQ3L860_9LILI|nr:14 kDa zinc-binding protein [Canna indica]
MASTTLTTSFSLLWRCRALRGHAISKPLPGISSIHILRPSTALLLPRRFMCHSAASSNEEAAAKAAADTADSGAPTIFDKIIAKEIPSTIVYEDEKVLAFRDINPQAPVHVLIIPKIRDGLTQLGKAELRHADILGHLLFAAKLVAEKEGIVDGFRVVINNGAEACQSVYHLHLHVIGGRQLKWPPG